MREGIRTCISQGSFDETVDRLQALLVEEGITLFCLVDHSGEARNVGLKMPLTKLLIFGKPRVGTPLMLAAPSLALDLPSKILVSEQPNGTVQISWNDPGWLQQRHGFPQEMKAALSGFEALIEKAVLG